MTSSRALGVTGLLLGLGLPTAASAAQLGPIEVFQNAALLVKADILALVAAAIVAFAICVAKLASGPRLTGGSAFLSGLRLAVRWQDCWAPPTEACGWRWASPICR